MAKKENCPERKLLGKTKNQKHLYCTSSAAQRSIILKYLQAGKALSTLEAREKLDILHPAARIMELRNRGWKIITHWEIASTNIGLHRIARYFLERGKAYE